ncbi:hypothetical protein DVH05_020092 [Phytophthora capsici]|nr:hypothetical protein DVH05_020092 [Phytophthora capsici]
MMGPTPTAKKMKKTSNLTSASSAKATTASATPRALWVAPLAPHFAYATDNYHPNGFDDVATTPIGSIDELLGSTDVREGLKAFDAIPRPSPIPSCSTQRQLRSAGLPKPNPPTTTGPSANMSEKPPAARARVPEESKKYVNISNRIGGGNLAEFRTSIGRKRGAEDEDDLAEASYAKVNRVKATKLVTQLKKCLSDRLAA